MKKTVLKNTRRQRRKRGIRRELYGSAARPRLSVFRSNKHIYVQLIDDLAGTTLAAACSNEKDVSVDSGGNCTGAAVVGTKIAERAREAGVDAIVFDRNGYKFHGRIKALADAAREGGLKF